MSDDFEFQEEEFTTQFNGSTVYRILSQTFPHWPYLVGFLILIGLVSLLDSYFTFLSSRIIDEGIVAQDLEVLRELVIQYGLLIIVQAALVFGFISMTGILGERVRYDMRKKLFNHLQSLSLSYYSRTPVGWIMSRVTSDTDRIAELVTWGILDVTWGIMNIATAAFFMLRINWRLALVVLATIPVLIVVATLFKRRILIHFRQARKMNSKITGAYNESITGVRVTKALGREDRNLVEFGELTGEMYRSSYRAAYLSALFLPVVQLISAVAVGAIAWYGGWMTTVGAMTIGGIQAFISYVTFMIWPIQEMARVYAEMQQSIASAERVFSLEDAVPDIVDRRDAFDPGSMAGDIVFKDVSFYYEDEAEPVLTDFNLHVRRGETIALVGPTGGGKSTIVNLLCRFYEPRAGSVQIAGHDFREYTKHALQSRIGMVLQTPHLFSGTILENIRYGRLDADEDAVVAAARMAGAHDFIKTLPKQYEEEVGEGGNLLSVGQKQLISLARAILAEPEIFIMDEATSSVDTLTEALIQQGMETLMEGRTSFIIAHRLSTIRRADRILVIEDGRIEEMGSHAELIRARGHYYRLYTQQFRQELEVQYDLFGSQQLEAAPA